MADFVGEHYQENFTIPEDDSIDFQKIIFKYLAHWPWFILSIFVLIVIGFVYLSTFQPLYQITATILIKDQNKGGGIPSFEELDLFYKAKVVENEIEIIRSFTILEEVVDELNLQVQYAMKAGWKTFELYKNSPVKIEIIAPSDELFSHSYTLYFEDEYIVFNEKMYPLDALVTELFGSIRITTTAPDSLLSTWNFENPLHITFLPKTSIIETLHKNLQVSLTKNTSVLTLSILSPVPQLGQDIINQLIIAYNKAAIADKNNMAGITLDFISDRLADVEKDLQMAEQNVEKFKVSKRVTDISVESSLSLQNIQQNEAELSKIRTQLDVLQQIEQYVISNSSASALPTIEFSDPTLISLISQLSAAETERSKALTSTQPTNPRVRALDDQILTLKGKLIDNIKLLRRSLETTQLNLQADSRRMESVINSIPKKTRELVDITRQQEIINQMYVFLLSKREETAISFAATVADSRIVDPARSTTLPVKPKKHIVLLAFGLIGLLIPIGVLWILDIFKTTISSKEDLERLLKVPLVGEISFIEQASKIVVFNKMKSLQADQIRNLRTNIEFMRAGGGIKVILLTSDISGEGKSFLTANIGAAFAVTGKKTIILGFDLRKTGLGKIFGIENEEGLSNYLAGQASFEQVIRKTTFSDNLHLITCGQIAPNPQELLLGDSLTQLLERLKKTYDYLIIDTPPIGLMSDAMILARHADVSLYVVRHNYTPKDRIKHINELSSSNHLKNVGVVVNGIKDTNWNGYGYGYGYGSYKYISKYYSNEEPDSLNY